MYLLNVPSLILRSFRYLEGHSAIGRSHSWCRLVVCRFPTGDLSAFCSPHWPDLRRLESTAADSAVWVCLFTLCALASVYSAQRDSLASSWPLCQVKVKITRERTVSWVATEESSTELDVFCIFWPCKLVLDHSVNVIATSEAFRPMSPVLSPLQGFHKACGHQRSQLSGRWLNGTSEATDATTSPI